MKFRRKWLFLALVIVLGVIVAFPLLLTGGPASLQFIGYGTDGAGLLLLSNRTERDLEFYRPEIEVRSADATIDYVQNYTIAPHRLDRHQSIVLRVDLPQGRFTWAATVRGPVESNVREHAEAVLRRFGIKHDFTRSEFHTSVVVPESNFRSGTNVVTNFAGVWEVIRRRPTGRGRGR